MSLNYEPASVQIAKRNVKLYRECVDAFVAGSPPHPDY